MQLSSIARFLPNIVASLGYFTKRVRADISVNEWPQVITTIVRPSAIALSFRVVAWKCAVGNFRVLLNTSRRRVCWHEMVAIIKFRRIVFAQARHGLLIAC